MYNVNLSETITPENVKYMGEMLAISAFKPFLKYADNIFGKLYKGLIKDINGPTAMGHTFSDGYDFAQTAICFLCEHIGKTLNDVLGADRRGRVVTVKLACFRTITRSMNKLFTNKRRAVCIENFYKLTAPAEIDKITEPQAEEDYTNVNEIIERLELTDKQRDALLCLMLVQSYSEAARILSLNRGTIWVTMTRIREKYIKIFSEPKLRTSVLTA